MAFTFTSRKFYNQFTGTGGGGVSYLNTNVADKVTCIIEGYFKWSLETARLTFDSASKKISLANQFDKRSFIDEGFKAGDTFTSVGTVSNNGSFTIVEVTARYITTVEALVNETAEAASVYGTTLVTAMDFYYNLIANSEQATYVSKTDKGTLQRYIVDGLDAAVATPVFMLVGSNSYGWVTDELTGDVSEVTVEGAGIADYKQKFKITQYFFHTNLWSEDLFTNLTDGKAPAEYTGSNSVKHICKVDGKFDFDSPVVDHTGELANVNGKSAWFNQSSAGTKAEYTLNGIVYQDFDTDEVLTTLQVKAKTKVSITVGSRNGTFVDNQSDFAIAHYFCPLNSADFIDTDTTMLQNFRFDATQFTIGDAPTDGIKFGTDYQSITDAEVEFIDANNCIVRFVVDYSDATKLYLKARPDSNRNYVIALACSDITKTETRNTDQVNLLCDFQSASYDYRNEDLMGMKDYFHGFPFPNTDINEVNNVAGYEGDYFYESVPFWIETASVASVTPTLNKVKIQILATKTGEDDFILEEKQFTTDTIRKLKGVQDINILNDRGFILPDDSVYNRANIIRRSDLDTGTKAYYEIQYGFVLRYETWRDVILDSLGNSASVFKDIEDVVQAWERYSQGNEWDMKFRVTFEVNGYDNRITIFQAETGMIVFDEDDAPATGPDFTLALSYFDENNVSIPVIQNIGTTRVVATFTGDPASFPAGFISHYGYLFFDNDPAGGIFNRRFATSEFDSESDSPFTTVDLPANGAVSSYESANLRLSYFANRIELDTFYVSEGDPQKQIPDDMYIGARLGFMKQPGIGQMEIGRTFIIQ